MKKAYNKPELYIERDARGLVPVVAAVAAAAGVSQAVAGLGLGLVAGGATALAGTAVAKKVGNDFFQLASLPRLDAIES